MKLALILFAISFSISASDSSIKPFKSDGCSGWKNGTRWEPNLWLECCVRHDLQYWKGGTKDQREEADRDFRKCVTKKSNILTALVMYVGVRIGGSPDYNTEYRWGYGWNKRRDYQAHSPQDLKAIEDASPRNDQQLFQRVDP